MTFLGSVPACAASYENYEIINSYPWLELAKQSFGLSHFQRTPAIQPSRFDERRFLSILGMAVKHAYNSVMSCEDALKQAQAQYEANAAEITSLY
jgi:multiple sugar transport system substrate-binding protein